MKRELMPRDDDDVKNFDAGRPRTRRAVVAMRASHTLLFPDDVITPRRQSTTHFICHDRRRDKRLCFDGAPGRKAP